MTETMIGGGELALWLLGEAKRAEDFAPRYQAASPFRIVWEERAKKLRAAAAALEPAQGVTEAVAWRCKDYADGWIIYQDFEWAKEMQREMGCLMQPLYAAPGSASLAEDVVASRSAALEDRIADLLASLDPETLNPEQFNAWSALQPDTMQPDVHDEGADFNGVVRPESAS